MAATTDTTGRLIIPRWRRFDLTAALGELGTGSLKPVDPRPASAAPVAGTLLGNLVADWRENRTFGFAADLVGAALAGGAPQHAQEAAQFILDLGPSVPTSALALARAALGQQTAAQAELDPKAPDREHSVGESLDCVTASARPRATSSFGSISHWPTHSSGRASPRPRNPKSSGSSTRQSIRPSLCRAPLRPLRGP